MNKKKTVFIFSYRLMDLKVLINSNVITELNKKLMVVIFSPKNLLEILEKNIPKNCHLNEIKTPIEKSLRNKNYNLKTKLINILRMIFAFTYAENKKYPNCISRKFQTKAFLNSKKSNKIKYILCFFIIFISYCLCKLRFLRKILNFLFLHLLKNNYHKYYYENLNPSLVIVGSSGLDSDGYILCEAFFNNVKTLVINNSWDKMVTKGYPIIKSDYLIVWNKHMQEEAINYLEYKEYQIFVEGSAYWDFLFQKNNIIDKNIFLSERKLNPIYPVIFYPLSSSFWHNDLIKTLNQLFNAKISNILDEKIQIIFRVHPYYWSDDILRNELFDVLKKIEKINGFFVDFNEVKKIKNTDVLLLSNDQKNMKNYYLCSDLLVSVSSSASIEMAFNFKPSLNILWGEWNQKDRKFLIKNYDLHHHKTMNSYNVFKNVFNFDELIKGINNFNKLQISKKNYQNLINGEFPLYRGIAYKKYAERIFNIIY